MADQPFPNPNQLEADQIDNFANYLETNKATIEPKAVASIEHFLDSFATTLENLIPFHGGLLKFLGDSSRAAVAAEDSQVKAQIDAGAPVQYEHIVADLHAYAAKVRAGQTAS